MPLTPGGNWFALAFLAMVLVLLAFNHDTQDRVVRGPYLGAGDGDRIFRLARTPHPTDPRARRGGHPRSRADRRSEPTAGPTASPTNGWPDREPSVTFQANLLIVWR